ncbi:hypothetical protein [Arthrobacter oryzae]|uniref:hypothetical protein n=1 Tax=Arthrobacter oryzae TaxID=409290 RepID=UPI0027852A01|nr:hypothetical protein [Arthrobacter oryzae]MDQ0076973.1 putative low-complexity protein [Arthrobacter oryzae]
MKKILATAGIAGIALIGVTAPANAGDNNKVNICHATGSESNPYVSITVSENAVNGNGGHGSHHGDLIPAPAGGCPGGSKGDHDHKDDDGGHGSKKLTICHATGSEKNPYVVITIPEKAWWNGHKDGHNGRADIYPVPAGGCVDKDHEKPPHEKPPVEKPPVEKPPVEKPPVVVPPVVVPPVVVPPVVVPPVVAPPAVTPPVVVAVPAGAAAAPVVNRGFNAQTAAGTQTDPGNPAWFGGLAALLGATGLVALRHRARLQDFQK